MHTPAARGAHDVPATLRRIAHRYPRLVVEEVSCSCSLISSSPEGAKRFLRFGVTLGACAGALAGTVASGLAVAPAQGRGPRFIVRSCPAVSVPADGLVARQARAYCQRGESVIGGGAEITGVGARQGEYFTFVTRSVPLPEPAAGHVPSGWLASATNTVRHFEGMSEPSILKASAVCAS